MSQDDDDWNTDPVPQEPTRGRGEQSAPKENNSWKDDAPAADNKQAVPDSTPTRGAQPVRIGSANEEVKEECPSKKEEAPEDNWMDDQPSELKNRDKQAANTQEKGEGRGERGERGEGRGEGRGERGETRGEGRGETRGEGRGEGRGRGQGRGQAQGEVRGQGRGEARGEREGQYGRGDRVDRRAGGGEGRGDREQGRGGYQGRGGDRGGERGGFNNYNNRNGGGGGQNRFNNDRGDRDNRGDRGDRGERGGRFGGNDRREGRQGRGEDREPRREGRDQGRTGGFQNRRDEDRPRRNDQGNHEPRTAEKPNKLNQNGDNKMTDEIRMEGWVTSSLPVGGKFRPELSICLNKTRVSIVMQNIFQVKKDMLVVAFNNDLLDIYPGAAVANAEPRVRLQLQKKREKWDKPDPETFNVITGDLKNFKGIIMVKYESVQSTLKKALDEFACIAFDQNFSSIVLPFLKGNDDVDKTSKEMIDTILAYFQKPKKKNLKIQDLSICVKEKEQFVSLEKNFREKIMDYVEKNMIWLE